MRVLASMTSVLHRRLATYLSQPSKRFTLRQATDLEVLRATLRVGDVILTEGNTRFAVLVRRLTGSPWTHVAMYVGPSSEEADPPCIIEADVVGGVREIPLSDLRGAHVRVARPIGLSATDRARLAASVRERIGHAYDLKNAIDLACVLFPLPACMGRWWRNMTDPLRPLGSADPNKVICSTLLAQAFTLVGLSIEPAAVLALQRVPSTEVALDHTYLTPHDFAASPHFRLIESSARPGLQGPMSTM